MFGKKKKLAKLAAEQAAQEAAARAQAEEELKKAQAIEDAKAIGEEKVFVESELCDDDDDAFDSTKEFEAIAYILKEEEGEALHAESLDAPVAEEKAEPAPQAQQPAPQQAPAQPAQQPQQPAPQPAQPVQEEVAEPELEEVEEEVEEVEEEQEPVEEPVQAEPVAQEVKEEVVYVVEGEEDDEIVKPAKLVKLPNLIDYMLMQNMTKRMKLNIATLLLSAYQKYKDIPQEKAIIVKCMAKVMASLLQAK